MFRYWLVFFLCMDVFRLEKILFQTGPMQYILLQDSSKIKDALILKNFNSGILYVDVYNKIHYLSKSEIIKLTFMKNKINSD